MEVHVHTSMMSMFADVTDTDGLTDALSRSLFSSLIHEVAQQSIYDHDLIANDVKRLIPIDALNESINRSYHYLWLAIRQDRAVIDDGWTPEEAVTSISTAILNLSHILSSDDLKRRIDEAFMDYDCDASELNNILRLAQVEYAGLTS